MPGARAPVPFEGPNTCRVLYYDQNYSLGSQNPTVTQNPTNCNYEGTCSPVTFRLPVLRRTHVVSRVLGSAKGSPGRVYTGWRILAGSVGVKGLVL